MKDLTLVECARAWSRMGVVRERPHPCGPDEAFLPDWLAIHCDAVSDGYADHAVCQGFLGGRRHGCFG